MSCAVLGLVLSTPVRADPIDALQQILADPQTSPMPAGWLAGGFIYTGSSPYEAGAPTTLTLPGAVIVGQDFHYLGDRAFYNFARDGGSTVYGRLRVRFGNLDPQDQPEWAGLHPRESQVEAGVGATLASPTGLWTARFSADVSGRSHGQEMLFNWGAPFVRERWIVMPGVAVFWRSAKLANYYFGGVAPDEAAPGRPAYDVGHAWSINPSLIASYRLTPRWLAAGLLSYEAFGSAIRDSPLVQKSGRYDVLVAAGYVFR